MYGNFKEQTGKILNEKTRILLRKGNIKRETKSILMLYIDLRPGQAVKIGNAPV